MKLIDISTPKHPNTFVKVDDADFDWLNQWEWHVSSSNMHNLYVTRHVWGVTDKAKSKEIKMHRLIMDAPSGMQVDHIDGDGLNNQRGNLRLCTNSQNQMNRSKKAGTTSRFKGVSFNSKDRIYHTRIGLNGKQTTIGRFKNEFDAAIAYNAAAKKYHGEFAKLNPIPQIPEAP